MVEEEMAKFLAAWEALATALVRFYAVFAQTIYEVGLNLRPVIAPPESESPCRPAPGPLSKDRSGSIS